MEIQKRYEELAGTRDTIYSELSELAQLTIPNLVPPIGAEEDYKHPIAYQSVGADGIQNLASKLMLTLFPPNMPFFKLSISDIELSKLGTEERGEVELGLNTIEREVVKFFEEGNTRIRIIDAVQLLLLTGNVLLRIMPDGSLKVFRMDSFVVVLDASDNVMEIIIKERLDKRMLPERISKMLSKKADDVSTPSLVLNNTVETPGSNYALPSSSQDRNEVDIYTQCRRIDANSWEVFQEVSGVNITDKKNVFKNDNFPFIVTMFNRPVGGTYGRGYVDIIKGDLITLEVLSAAMHDGSVAAARTIFLARPGSVIDRDLLQDAPNLSVLQGEEGDITTVKSDKAHDMSIVAQYHDKIEKRLGIAFLRHMTIQREQDRVTAEEIRMLTQELDAGRGALHSTIAQNLQLPLIKFLLGKPEMFGIPKIPKEVKPMITTGVQSFGRTSDYMAIRELFADFAPLLGPEMLNKYLNLPDALKRAVAAKGIDAKGFVKTTQEVQAEEQQRMQMMQEQQSAEILSRTAPTLAKAATEQPQQPQA